MSDRKTKFHLESSPDNELFEPPEPLRLGAHLKSLPGYHQAYDRSTREADQFWLEIAKELHFKNFSGQGLEFNFDMRKGPVYTRFLSGSTTNISYNCLERMIAAGKCFWI
jgi:acetyl-CoA synthetase